MLSMLHERAFCDMRAAVSLAPDLKGGLEAMRTEAGWLSAAMHLALVSGQRPDLQP